MNKYCFRRVYLDQKWRSDQLFTLDDHGIIVDIKEYQGEDCEIILGPVLPGFINSHSHSFQYAMAGLAENFMDPADDFWSWRNTMYDIALQIGPEQLEAVTAMLYSELLRHGYTQVVEFHYLHHDINGKPFANLAENAERIVAAADRTGIELTLVPVMYSKGGFGREPEEKQRRFISHGTEEYLKLHGSCRDIALKGGAMIGYGAHSLRAVDREQLKQLAESNIPGPFHIHVAEQLKEVDACLEYHGTRPVELLLDNFPVNTHSNLVHATHLSNTELERIARSGAAVVICPITEGNLGDGIFRFREYLQAGGHYSIGSDSHVGISPTEELRWLEYQQRLTTHKRTVFPHPGRTGDMLHNDALRGGEQGSGRGSSFDIGNTFNAVILDDEHPLLNGTGEENILNTFIYSSQPDMIKQVITRGKVRVSNGRHELTDGLRRDFAKTIKELSVR